MSKLKFFLNFIGIYPSLAYNNLLSLIWYFKDLKKLKSQKLDDASFSFGKMYPILNEKTSQGGTMSGHYFHQDLLVAQKIYANNPTAHVDIGSRIDGFIAHVATFRKIEVFDIRPVNSVVHANIKFIQSDLMDLDNNLINYTDSISCLHVIEHFGLGRYGDPVDYHGHIKGLNNIYKILKPKGTFYFSTPIGTQRIEFNAHRIFSMRYLLDYINNLYEIKSFSFVDDVGELHVNAALSNENIEKNFGCEYGCAIFELIKI